MRHLRQCDILDGLDVDIIYKRSAVTLQAIKEDILKFSTPFQNFNSTVQSDLDLQLAIHLTDVAFRLTSPVDLIH